MMGTGHRFILLDPMEKNLGVFGLFPDKCRSCFTTEVHMDCQIIAQKILHRKCCNFYYVRFGSNLGLLNYPKFFPIVRPPITWALYETWDLVI